jgi:surfeit locus 1 family protein
MDNGSARATSPRFSLERHLMIRRMIFPVLMGLAGIVVLVGLGNWQVERMYWKSGVLAEINRMIDDPPVALMAQPDPVKDKFRPVFVTGRFTGDYLEVLSGQTGESPGVRIIEAFEVSDGRRIMVDRGFITQDARAVVRTPAQAKVIGNLHWPQDGNAYTPPPDEKTGLWFARDVDAMAVKLNTFPTLIVASEQTGDAIEAIPVDTSSIPNDHWGYAITWYLLALVWAVMTFYLLWRIQRRTV